ncbi:hypothetical protein PS639_03746 [Pseudomonas fluorescens]|nr:DUF2635 domain-containing protein [Pseudomonas fluorescens]VVN10187.1 hypothetical protein PS639_03746 [Pseudomonas fluorescens]
MSRMTVYPAAGRVVPDPEAGDDLPAEGRDVPRDAYWLRRLRDQDVTTEASKHEDVTPDAPPKAKAATKTPASATLGSAE